MIRAGPTVRVATPADVPRLVAWNAAMAAETEDRQLEHATLTAGVRGLFDDARRGLYFIAEMDGEAVGGLLVTYEWSDWRNGDFWWIQSVYVVPAARRRGVFRSLYAAVAERAHDSGAVGLRLYVERDNTRAQQTYASLGMQRCRYHMYEQLFA